MLTYKRKHLLWLQRGSYEQTEYIFPPQCLSTFKWGNSSQNKSNLKNDFPTYVPAHNVVIALKNISMRLTYFIH